MRHTLIAALLVATTACGALATSSELPSYYAEGTFNLTSPSALTTAVGGYYNPAVYPMMPGTELEFYFSDPKTDAISGLNRWGAFTGLNNLGFGFIHERGFDAVGNLTSVTDYRLALAGGTRAHALGVSVGWQSGNKTAFNRTTIMQVGVVERFGRHVSLGLNGTFSTEVSDQSGLFDLAVRPLGDERFTVFGDLEYPRGYSFKNSPWSAGAMLEVPSGVKIVGRYFENESFSLALAYTFGGGINTGKLRGSAQPYWNESSNHAATNWGVRVGYAERNGVLTSLTESNNYVAMELRGPVRHTRFKYFDRGMTLSHILASLEGARTDPRVAGVALNLSGVKISNGSAWEIREKLAQLQRDGKHVVVFIDNAGMATYHLASVADRVVMDPQGMFMLPGYAMGRTYLNRLAEKLGVGVEEWRFKDYKSAMEGLVRRDMSPEDREQRQALVDEYYATFRSEAASSRRVEESTVDEWVDDMVIVMPLDAVEQGMVDELALWDDIGRVVAEFEGDGKRFIKADDTARYAYPAVEWGEPDRIAVVYAIGGTEMDSGMNARRVQKTIRALKRNRTVKAIVLRVNSPGGDAMASNVVAEAIRDCQKVKPVIVSQADVAASGGYWVSMYADEIIAQPTTITGSIGVIAGWVWDDGLSDKLGVDTDHVKAGAHADLFVNMRFPFLPLGIPYRQVTDDEREQALAQMEKMYNGFVAKVAEGRGMTVDQVAEIAKGRVWTGAQGLENGLIDRIGGLNTAIEVARDKAGLEKDDYVQVVEYGSTRGLFNPDFLKPLPLTFKWFGGGPEQAPSTDVSPAAFLLNYEMFYLQQLSRFNGRPQCLIPPEYLPQTAGEEMP